MCKCEIGCQRIDNADVLGNNISSNTMFNAAINSVWWSFTLFITDVWHIYGFIKCKLFMQCCCSFYGSSLRSQQNRIVDVLCVTWSQTLNMVRHTSPATHCGGIATLSDTVPIEFNIKCTFIRLVKNSMIIIYNTVAVVA